MPGIFVNEEIGGSQGGQGEERLWEELFCDTGITPEHARGPRRGGNHLLPLLWAKMEGNSGYLWVKLPRKCRMPSDHWELPFLNLILRKYLACGSRSRQHAAVVCAVTISMICRK